MFLDHYEGTHLKDMTVDWMDSQRRMSVEGREVVNFGSDSFLGLDWHPNVLATIRQSLDEWGSHNGTSRAFTSASICDEAEQRVARWLGVEDTLIFPSVTLANAGLIPALAGEDDLLIVDRLSHDSIQQSAKIAAGNGAKVLELSPCDPDALRSLLKENTFKGLVVAVDGVYSMTGKIPPLAELDEVTREFGGILYVDDAHGTAVVGERGRGAAYKRLGRLDQVLMVGSLSKAFSCLGAFITCDATLRRILKIRSNTFIFGGPVPPAYLAGICAVCDILESDEFEELSGRLQQLIDQLVNGAQDLGLKVLGGEAPIISVEIGDIETTLEAGKFLFDRGFYVQSATFPAVPITAGLVRIQVNANHTEDSVSGLVTALAELKEAFGLPNAAQTPSSSLEAS